VGFIKNSNIYFSVVYLAVRQLFMHDCSTGCIPHVNAGGEKMALRLMELRIPLNFK
jgi:hypothetical protein